MSIVRYGEGRNVWLALWETPLQGPAAVTATGLEFCHQKFNGDELEEGDMLFTSGWQAECETKTATALIFPLWCIQQLALQHTPLMWHTAFNARFERQCRYHFRVSFHILFPPWFV